MKNISTILTIIIIIIFIILLILRVSGFVQTKYHDPVLIANSILALVNFIGLLKKLQKKQMIIFIFTFLLLAVNFALAILEIYPTDSFIYIIILSIVIIAFSIPIFYQWIKVTIKYYKV